MSVNIDFFSVITLSVVIETLFGGDFDAIWMRKQWNDILQNFRRYGVGLTLFGDWFKYFPFSVTRNYNKGMKNVIARVKEAISKKRLQKLLKLFLISF